MKQVVLSIALVGMLVVSQGDAYACFVEAVVPEIVLLNDQAAGGSCFSWGTFIEGRKYLVYADETTGKDLGVKVGNRSAPLAGAAKDLNELDKMSRPFLKPQSGPLSPGAGFLSMCLRTNC